jgi:hypothetical protein
MDYFERTKIEITAYRGVADISDKTPAKEYTGQNMAILPPLGEMHSQAISKYSREYNRHKRLTFCDGQNICHTSMFIHFCDVTKMAIVIL